MILTDATVGPERDVVLEERRMRVDNDPQSLMSEQMRAALHLSHPYGRPGDRLGRGVAPYRPRIGAAFL